SRGMRVTGSELVGLVPLQAMLDAGRHFLRKQQRSLGVPDAETIHIAVKSLGLDELGPFNPEERIIEYRMREGEQPRLASSTLTQFADATAAETAAPGGGSTAALVGALGAALGTMVANLSAHKRGWDERWEEFSHWAERGQELKSELLHLVDEDTLAYERVMAAIGMPKGSEEEKVTRRAALEAANRGAIEVPWTVMRTAFDVFELVGAMAEHGNPASASDAGVGALCARAAVRGAWLNVRTNVAGLKDRDSVADILTEGARLDEEAAEQEARILRIVEKKFG
ncbi:MAG TPA: cyclodeaminase/cyclohydrolase family protein, partial [Gemmatimonadales bacterium]|nr:cyclodeaminase/cyclohydrolase family protein [Gemmatimonadales bacterium]